MFQLYFPGATASEIADALRRTNNPSTYLAEDILEKKAQEAQEELEKEQELKDEERKKEEGNKKIPAYLAEHLKKKQRKEEDMSFARRVVREEESKAADWWYRIVEGTDYFIYLIQFVDILWSLKMLL